MALRIPVLLDCRKPFPPIHNKHVPLQQALMYTPIELIQTVDALHMSTSWIHAALAGGHVPQFGALRRIVRHRVCGHRCDSAAAQLALLHAALTTSASQKTIEGYWVDGKRGTTHQ